MKHLILILLFATVKTSSQQSSILINPAVAFTPCIGDQDIYVNYEPGLPPDEENTYNLTITKNFTLQTNVVLKFNTNASIVLEDNNVTRIDLNPDNSFTISFYKPKGGIQLKVKGLIRGIIPYLVSLVINNVEHCTKPYVGHLDYYIQGEKDTAVSLDRKPQGACGRRQLKHTDVNGTSTKPGDWPWNVALYTIDHSSIKYICGGTLISKTYVLTAAHCVTLRGVPVLPESISVVLGKFNLIEEDTESQEIEVFSLIVHEEFNHGRLDNDIALLKLKSEVVFNDYIQLACVWNPKLVDKLPSTEEIYGTVVGWGFKNDALAPQISKAKMPFISPTTCAYSNPVFFGGFLKDNTKFCAGYRNGTSACIGGSGSAFQVFVPDQARDDNPGAQGAWFVRGIMSTGLTRAGVDTCDPEEYVVFTDVEKYKSWIDNYISE